MSAEDEEREFRARIAALGEQGAIADVMNIVADFMEKRMRRANREWRIMCVVWFSVGIGLGYWIF